MRALDPTRLISAALLVERSTVAGKDAMAIQDPLVGKLDVLAVNTYAGWYGSDSLDALANLAWQVPGDRPLILSETGVRKQAFGVLADYYRSK